MYQDNPDFDNRQDDVEKASIGWIRENCEQPFPLQDFLYANAARTD
jgi:hypothetical protein